MKIPPHVVQQVREAVDSAENGTAEDVEALASLLERLATFIRVESLRKRATHDGDRIIG